MKQKLVFLTVLLIGLVVKWGCSEVPTEPENTPNYLFKATFVNERLKPEDGEAGIFLSDNDGNILADTIFSENDSYELYLENGLNKSSTDNLTHINVTIVKKNNITTSLNIPIGSSWTLKGYPSIDYDNPIDSVKLDFENVPNYDDYYVVSSKWNSRISKYGDIGTPFYYNFYESPMDIYVKINTVSNGVKYLWLDNVTSGNRQDDLSNMNSAMSKTINLPNNNGYRKYLYGISNPGHRYEGRYRIDYGRDYNPTNSVEVYYPQQSFTDYRTRIYLIEELYQKEWYQSTYGEIPNSFTKIDADFNFVSASVDNFEISASGDYLETLSIWRWRTDDFSRYWYVYAGKENIEYKLPIFPNSVKQIFNLDRTSFELWLVDLMDYPELSSYSEILETVYNSQEYFYDVVNEYRRYTKYAPEGLLKIGNNKTNFVDERKDPHSEY